MQTTMMQKVKDALHQREDMRTQKEDAFAAKEAVSTAINLLIVKTGKQDMIMEVIF